MADNTELAARLRELVAEFDTIANNQDAVNHVMAEIGFVADALDGGAPAEEAANEETSETPAEEAAKEAAEASPAEEVAVAEPPVAPTT